MKIDGFFYNNEHKDRYLRGCVLLHNKSPVLIERLIDENYVRCEVLEGSWDYHFLGRGERKTVELNLLDEGWEYGTSPTGFVNFTYEERGQVYNYAFSIHRVPSRMWKVGVTYQSITFSSLRGPPSCPLAFSFHNPGFIQLCQDSYPSLEETYDRVNARRNTTTLSYAFSRKWATGKVGDRTLFYYNFMPLPIGHVEKTAEGPVLLLHQDYFYLQQLIESEGYRCELSNKSLG